MKYIKTFEKLSKNDLIKSLQDYLSDKLWIDIKFNEGVEQLSKEINKVYEDEPYIVPNRKYHLSVAGKEEVKGWFIISGEYKVNDLGRKRLDNIAPQYALLHTPHQFKRLLKYVDSKYLEEFELLCNVEKYNL